jgi:Fe-Mn family superoxide dismutase
VENIVFKPDFIDLNPFLTKESIDIHFNYHHMQYYRNLTSMIGPISNIKEVLVSHKDNIKIQNNALQIINHNLFWMSLSKQQEDEEIQALLEEINFYEKFRDCANSLFGSGWAWLTYSNQGFEIFSTSNAASPLDKTPLLVLDLWEHAYYVAHQWNRKEYIDEFFKVINFSFIRQQLELVKYF